MHNISENGAVAALSAPYDPLLDYRHASQGSVVVRRDPLRTQCEILDVATAAFAEQGLDGARIDEIAKLTRTSKRMIYYYFGSKEGLYEAVLERAFRQKWQTEDDLDVSSLEAIEALRRLVDHMYASLTANPVFVRLMANENIQRGSHFHKLHRLRAKGPAVLRTLERVIAQGQAEGTFRCDLDAWDLYWLINALSLYTDCDRPEQRSRTNTITRDAVIGWALANADAQHMLDFQPT